MSEKIRENYLRRWAERLGLTLQKSRGKKWALHDHMRYKLSALNEDGFDIIFGSPDFDLTLDQVEQHLKEYEEKLKK